MNTTQEEQEQQQQQSIAQKQYPPAYWPRNVEEEVIPHRLPDNFEPSKYDILCGKGKQCFHNVGNLRLRVTVEIYMDSYLNKSDRKSKKSSIVSQILCAARSYHPERLTGFVRKDRATGVWYEIGDKAARDKIGHIIRDLANPECNSRAFPSRPDSLVGRRRRRRRRKAGDDECGVEAKMASKDRQRGVRPTKKARRNTSTMVVGSMGMSTASSDSNDSSDSSNDYNSDYSNSDTTGNNSNNDKKNIVEEKLNKTTMRQQQQQHLEPLSCRSLTKVDTQTHQSRSCVSSLRMSSHCLLDDVAESTHLVDVGDVGPIPPSISATPSHIMVPTEVDMDALCGPKTVLTRQESTDSLLDATEDLSCWPSLIPSGDQPDEQDEQDEKEHEKTTDGTSELCVDEQVEDGDLLTPYPITTSVQISSDDLTNVLMPALESISSCCSFTTLSSGLRVCVRDMTYDPDTDMDGGAIGIDGSLLEDVPVPVSSSGSVMDCVTI